MIRKGKCALLSAALGAVAAVVLAASPALATSVTSTILLGRPMVPATLALSRQVCP